MPIHQPKSAHLMASPEDVEAQFYEALREADLDKLMALWADDDEVFCVHPGGPRVVGPLAIRTAFEAMFASSGRIHAQPERVRRVLSIDSAVGCARRPGAVSRRSSTFSMPAAALPFPCPFACKC